MIRVQNIYYMLAYAFRSLNEKDEQQYSSEQFDYAADLFATILSDGVTKQIKRGLLKEYVTYRKELSVPRGKIALSDTINKFAKQQKTVVCDVDEYVENTYTNQILKSVLLLLLKSIEVRPETKHKLKGMIAFFQRVEEVSIRHIAWKKLRFHRNNNSYKMLIYICQLILEGMIMGDDSRGQARLKEFIDDQQMHDLYERFILEYYKKHYPQCNVSSSQIEWNIDDDERKLLPRMRSDIMIEYHGKCFIIDAKYYNSSLQTNNRYGNQTIHSNNLYQIYAYVKNKDVKGDKSVSGMILYAYTEGNNPDVDYMMAGNRISVKTLNLNCNFERVREQLDGYITDWINEKHMAKDL